MNIDPKKLAEEATAKVSGLGGNLMDQAKDKLGDVIDQVKEKANCQLGETIKDKAADLLEGLADKLKH